MWRQGNLPSGKNGADTIVNEAYRVTIQAYKEVGKPTSCRDNPLELREEVMDMQKLV